MCISLREYVDKYGGIIVALIDYKCKGCGKSFFEIVNSADEKVACPDCKSEEVERVYKGKYYGKGSCGGNCSSGCSGCH